MVQGPGETRPEAVRSFMPRVCVFHGSVWRVRVEWIRTGRGRYEGLAVGSVWADVQPIEKGQEQRQGGEK